MLSFCNVVENVGHTKFVPHMFVSDSVFLDRIHCPMLRGGNGVSIQNFLFLPYCSLCLSVERRQKEYYAFHNFLCQVFDSLRDQFTFQ
jgi:hypothetical protein